VNSVVYGEAVERHVGSNLYDNKTEILPNHSKRQQFHYGKEW
jgi:hypothetical protein